MYPLRIGLIVASQTIRQQVEAALADLPVRPVVDLAALEEHSGVMDKIERAAPEVLFLDISCCQDRLEEAVRSLKALPPGPAIFALHEQARSSDVLAAFRAGVCEFLSLPLRGELREGLERVAADRKKRLAETRPGARTLAVLSGKGGCGATTIACHLAHELQKQARGKTLLADMDLVGGNIDFLMKTSSAYSLYDALGNVHRLDASFWKGVVAASTGNLDVLSAPKGSAAQQPAGGQIQHLLTFARSQYDWVVLDLGRGLGPIALEAIEHVDETFIVSTFEIPALHQTKQITQTLIEGGCNPARLRLLLNRVPKRTEITLEELEQMIGIPIYATLASDYPALAECYAAGKLLSPAANLGRQFARLSLKLSGAAEGTVPKSRRLWKGFSWQPQSLTQ